MAERRFAAVDLGARAVGSRSATSPAESIELEIAHRFVNRAFWLPDGLHWNLAGLFVGHLEGLALAGSAGRLDGVGVDAGV